MLETPCREYQGSWNTRGYGMVSFGPQRFTKAGKKAGRKPVGLHCWVMAQFLGRDLLPGEVVRHRCDNPPCFLFEHLELGSQADNVADTETRGRGNHPRGENHGNSKLTEDDVRRIRAEHATTNQSFRDLATKFDVHRDTVRNIVRRRRWSRIP